MQVCKIKLLIRSDWWNKNLKEFEPSEDKHKNNSLESTTIFKKTIALEKQTLDAFQTYTFSLEELLPKDYKLISQFLFILGISTDQDPVIQGQMTHSNEDKIQILTPCSKGNYNYSVVLSSLNSILVFSTLLIEVENTNIEAANAL